MLAGMIIVSGHTALDYYRSHRFSARHTMLSTKDVPELLAQANRDSSPSKVLGVDLESYGLLSAYDTVCVLVANRSVRRANAGVTYRLWSGELASGMLRVVSDELCVPSPEFLFLLSAGQLSIPKLVELGTELCGKYLVGSYYNFGGPRPPALTTLADLASFVERFPGTRGYDKAMMALRYVRENSWSAMETKVVVILCLPSRMGGYGAPLPILNPAIPLLERQRPIDGRCEFDGDMLWKRVLPNGTVIYAILEYDGRQHQSHQAILRDKHRDNILSGKGFRLLRAQYEDIATDAGMDYLARDLFAALEIRRRPASASVTQKRHETRRLILADDYPMCTKPRSVQEEVPDGHVFGISSQ
ncbi:Uncharacterised protein [Slackia heliotrinireducens]|uniref:DUF559 domain-containing protein n=2 Tax=Slackia TaxID=84108 RepID=C7N4B1_SLAHD|nr:DUF559 domain-containing protein [Slackia heliotrinireducens]ACV21746.1 hypothetical protein Shel_06870 [Slackia heliotrinireducens DSM 20476]VEG99393.1 Uncharacterised protein [Slackia heliotrinireducens]